MVNRNGMQQSADRIIISLVALAATTMASVVAAGVLIDDSTAVIASIIGVSSPVMLGLLGILINSLTKHINSRMSELIDLTRTGGVCRGKTGRARERTGVRGGLR
jgi:hypothetical protein